MLVSLLSRFDANLKFVPSDYELASASNQNREKDRSMGCYPKGRLFHLIPAEQKPGSHSDGGRQSFADAAFYAVSRVAGFPRGKSR
jgi:hypothetical protein